jgi:hypothetical protein
MSKRLQKTYLIENVMGKSLCLWLDSLNHLCSLQHVRSMPMWAETAAMYSSVGTYETFDQSSDLVKVNAAQTQKTFFCRGKTPKRKRDSLSLKDALTPQGQAILHCFYSARRASSSVLERNNIRYHSGASKRECHWNQDFCLRRSSCLPSI